MGHELTDREAEVLGLMATALSNEAIADIMGIKQQSVESYCLVIYSKLMVDEDTVVDRRVSAVLWWQEEQIQAEYRRREGL